MTSNNVVETELSAYLKPDYDKSKTFVQYFPADGSPKDPKIEALVSDQSVV